MHAQGLRTKHIGRYVPARLGWVGSAVLALLVAVSASATQIQDIVRIAGSEDNVITGMGLVVGLNKTGDGGDFAPAHEPLVNMIVQRMDENANLADLRDSQSVALVYIEARVSGSGARMGDMMDVTLATVGPAKSLEGGVLVSAVLLGPEKPDGEPADAYAIATGTVRLPDPEHPTRGRIRGGAQMIDDIPPFSIDRHGRLTLIIDEQWASWQLATHIADTINGLLAPDGPDIARAVDQKNITINVPEVQLDDPGSFITQILVTNIDAGATTNGARVTLNRDAGTIVINGFVELNPITISHNGFTITVGQRDEDDTQAAERTTIQELLDAFDLLNIPAEERIDIVEILHDNGALLAHVERE